MKRFNLHIPGWVYSMTVYGKSKQDALVQFKDQNSLSRMPNNYAIWELV